MGGKLSLKRSFAIVAAIGITTLGAGVLPAAAAGAHQDRPATSGHAQKSNKGQAKSSRAASGQSKHQSNSHHAGGTKSGSTTSGHTKSGHTKSGGTTSGQTNSGGSANGTGKGGSRPGNNGTVKIAPLGQMDGIPQNSPHPGCTFQIEWYGYDEGADIISTVSFAMQAPTKDVGLTVDGPSTVFVGGDPATGAGTPTGLDGVQAYTLSFDGAPQAQQGYHVKLTVATPRSNGNDTKTKVFWVQDCTPATETPGTGTETPGTDTETPGTGTETPGTETPGTGIEIDTDSGSAQGGGTDVLGEQAQTHNQIDVLGEQATAPNGTQANGQVPTEVDSGLFGDNWTRSTLPLLIVALGAAVGVIGFAARRRNRARLDA